MNHQVTSMGRILSLLAILAVLGTKGISGLTKKQSEGQPYGFIQEPPNRVDFLNELGVVIPCQGARISGVAETPKIQWIGPDNKVLQNVTNFRVILPNGSLHLLPFQPAAYRQDLHTTTYKCISTSSVGILRSRDVHIRAVVSQQWAAKVRSDPPEVYLKQGRKSATSGGSSPSAGSTSVLFKCDIDLIGGGREFIEVLGWKWEQHHFAVKPHSVAGERGGRFHLLPNGDLIVDRILNEDTQSRIICFTRHRLTRQEVQSSPFYIKLTDSPPVVKPRNTMERYPDPILVEEGKPIILHCTGSYPASNVRWERLNAGAWIEVINFSSDKSTLKIGNALVVFKSKRIHTGQYRCTYFGKGENQNLNHIEEGNHVEYQVRVSGESFAVKATINQDKSPLGGSAELMCTTNSNDGPISLIWYKDNNLVTPGGRFRMLGNNILQISQIQRDDQGFYQCFGRRERESSQSAILLQLANSPPRLVLGFLEQTIGGPGPDISLRCVFHSGYPLPSISWMIDGYTPVQDSRIIVGDHVTSHGDVISYYNITGTRVEDGGFYSCLASNKVTSVRHSARLNIYGSPWVRVVPPVVAISGEFLELQCPVSGYPIAGIGWEKAGGKLSSNGRIRVGSNGTLTILSVERSSDGGTYTCSAWDSGGRTARRDIQVNVVAPLRIAPFPDKSSVVEEERVTLVCALSSGSGTLKWEKVGAGESGLLERNQPRAGPASTSPFTVLATDGFTSLLSIPAVKSSHAGNYMCTAYDTISTVSRSHELTVLVAPKWTHVPKDKNVTRGEEVSFDCGGEGVPGPGVSWLKSTGGGGKGGSGSGGESSKNLEMKWRPIESLWPGGNVQSLQNGSLIFFEAEENHEGEYMCKLENGIGSGESKIVRLHVNVPPYFIKTLERQSVSQGKSHEVTCEVHGDAPITVLWMKGNVVFENTPANRVYATIHREGKKTRSTLMMKNLDPAIDKGIYQCIANNSLGKVSQTFLLWVEEKPNAPEDLTAVEVEARAVALEWRPPRLGPSNGEEEEDSAEEKARILLYIVEYSLAGESGGFGQQRVDVLGDLTGVKVGNLLPSSTYVFRVGAVNSAGNGPQTEVTIRTLTAPPSGSVTNVRALPVADRGIVISWSPLGKDLSYGPVLAYRISISNHVSLDEPMEIYAPPDGAAFTGKSFEGVNSDGWSESSKEILYLSNGGNARKNRSKSLSKLISIKNDGPSSCCQYRVNGLMAFTQYEIVISAVNSAGIGPGSGAIHIRTLEDVPESPIRVPNCIRLSSQNLQLSWQPPLVSNGLVNSYKIVYYPVLSGNKLKSPETHQTAGVTTIITGLEASTNYSIHITAVNRAGESTESFSMFCDTLEDVPGAPLDIVALPSAETAVYLNWLPPRRLNGVLTHYTVYFRIIEGSSESFESKRKVSPTAVSYIESGLDLKHLKYVFWVTSSNSKGESPMSEQVIIGPSPPVKARLVGQSRTVQVFEGQSTSLHCGIIGMGNNGPASVKWTVNGGKTVAMTGNIFMKPGLSELMFSSVRKSDAGNYSCQADEKMKRSLNEIVTYRLRVKGLPAIPSLEYRLEKRDIIISWTISGNNRDADEAPVGFILFYRSLGSVQEYKRIAMPPTWRNYTIKNQSCGSIINIYMVAYNEVGTSADSGALNVHVNHHISKMPTREELLVMNSTSIRLNLYPLNANKTFCPVATFSIAVRESRAPEWLPGKDERFPYKHDHIVYGLKESTSYELLLTAFGLSSSKSATYNFITLNQYGELPAVDVTTKNMVRDYSPFYSNLTLIIPVVIAVIAVVAAFGSVLAYWKTRRVVDNGMPHLVSRPPLPPAMDPHHERKGAPPHYNNEQLYSTLPFRPYLTQTLEGRGFNGGGPPGGGQMYPEMEDISPYATFQLAGDPMKKFREEGFSQDIVVPKFYDVMQEQSYRDNYHGTGTTTNTRDRRGSSNIYDDRWLGGGKKSGSSRVFDPSLNRGPDPMICGGDEEDDEDYDEMRIEDVRRRNEYYKLPPAHLLNPADVIKAEMLAKHFNLTQQQQAFQKLQALAALPPGSRPPPEHEIVGGIPYGMQVPGNKASNRFLGDKSGMGKSSTVRNAYPGSSSSSETSSPPQYYHTSNNTAKRRSSAENKKVSGGTLNRWKRNKDDDPKEDSIRHQDQLNKSRHGDRIQETGTEQGKILDAEETIRTENPREGKNPQNCHVLESDYSIAV